MMDEFVDYVSTNSARTGALCIAGCAKFTFQPIDKCVCVSYMYLGHVCRTRAIKSAICTIRSILNADMIETCRLKMK